MTDIIEKEKQKIDEKKKKIRLEEKILREKERQIQARKCEELGVIAFKAGLYNLDKTILLGAFFEIVEKAKDQKNLEYWKSLIKTFHEDEIKTSETPLSISFAKDPTNEIRKAMKKANFKWNDFRKEFYGYGNKIELESILKNLECKIEALS